VSAKCVLEQHRSTKERVAVVARKHRLVEFPLLRVRRKHVLGVDVGPERAELLYFRRLPALRLIRHLYAGFTPEKAAEPAYTHRHSTCCGISTCHLDTKLSLVRGVERHHGLACLRLWRS